MALPLCIIAIMALSCVFFNRVSSKLGIPALLAFILLGMFFGIDGVVKIKFGDYAFSEQLCSIALIFIMFYGGFGTKWQEAKPVAVPAILLSTLGVALTAAFTGLFCHYVMGFGWLEGMLIGSVLGSTDAASVFSILRSKKLGLKFHTDSLLEVESGSNDPCAYMLTAVVLSLMEGGTSGGQIVRMILAQIAYGLLCGVGIAFAALWMLQRFKFSTDGFDAVFVLAVARSELCSALSDWGKRILKRLSGRHHPRQQSHQEQDVTGQLL